MIVYLDENANNSCAGGWRTGHNTTQLPEMLKRSINSREPRNRNGKRKLGNTARFTDKKMNNKESQ